MRLLLTVILPPAAQTAHPRCKHARIRAAWASAIPCKCGYPKALMAISPCTCLQLAAHQARRLKLAPAVIAPASSRLRAGGQQRCTRPSRHQTRAQMPPRCITFAGMWGQACLPAAWRHLRLLQVLRRLSPRGLRRRLRVLRRRLPAHIRPASRQQHQRHRRRPAFAGARPGEAVHCWVGCRGGLSRRLPGLPAGEHLQHSYARKMAPAPALAHGRSAVRCRLAQPTPASQPRGAASVAARRCRGQQRFGWPGRRRGVARRACAAAARPHICAHTAEYVACEKGHNAFARNCAAMRQRRCSAEVHARFGGAAQRRRRCAASRLAARLGLASTCTFTWRSSGRSVLQSSVRRLAGMRTRRFVETPREWNNRARCYHSARQRMRLMGTRMQSQGGMQYGH